MTINPLVGKIGDEFTITLRDWTSAYRPIEYNVFSTFDSSGSRKGQLINKFGPIPVSESFSFKADRTTPVIVQVFDRSGETLEYLLEVEIESD